MTRPRLMLTAGPLIARSGVYNSACELVGEANQQGLEWSGHLFVSSRAGGESSSPPGVTEVPLEPRGLGGVRALRGMLLQAATEFVPDVVVSLTPQSDMALATTRLRWISYLRGLPWPAVGEARPATRLAWRTLETAAVRRAADRWSTTEELLAASASIDGFKLMPPGVRQRAREWDGSEVGDRVVTWAGRFSSDKNPEFFGELADGGLFPARMLGTGPLEPALREDPRTARLLGGWVPSAEIWRDASVFVGTSTREAFGRSAVEAAMSGVPVVMAQGYGAARFLYTDPELAAMNVLPLGEAASWRRAIERLLRDAVLRQECSEHVASNAAKLSMSENVRRIQREAAELVGHRSR